MPLKLIGNLKLLREHQGKKGIPFVFQKKIGGPVDLDALCDVLRAAQDAAQVRLLGLHGLRHLYCSLLQVSGASSKFAQERLGHADASTTVNIYTHTIDNHEHDFADKVEGASSFDSCESASARQVMTVEQ